MSRRNLVWILAVSLLAVLFWQMPNVSSRNRSIYEVFSPLVDIHAQIHGRYVEPVDDEALLTGAIEGMLGGLDPYSRYIPATELESFNQQTSGMVPGIGIFLSVRDGMLTVISPLEDSPAFRAGIMPGDRIIGIEGESTKSMTLSEAARRLRGKAGTRVVFDVQHALSGRRETLTLQRAEVRIRSVKGYIRRLDGGWDYLVDREARIAYIRITQFVEGTGEELQIALGALHSERAAGLVLDLRGNPGGLLKSAVAVANLFIDEGAIVTTKGRWAKAQTVRATSDNTYPPVPMAVLINHGSASASEIVAGALRDHGRATVIGTRSFGKGSVQSLFPLEGGRGAIKITTAYYYLPKGRNIHRRADAEQWGVDPDIELALRAEEFMAVRESRRTADLLFQPGTTTGTAPTTGTRSASPKPLIIDRQLARALAEVRGRLAEGAP